MEWSEVKFRVVESFVVGSCTVTCLSRVGLASSVARISGISIALTLSPRTQAPVRLEISRHLAKAL